MGWLHLVRRNLGRRKLRTTFTLASIIVAFTLFALLGGLNRAFNAGVELAGADRLITTHKVSFIQLMPVSYTRRAAEVEGVEAVTHYTWFGAYYRDPKQQFGLFPTDLEKLPEIYPEYTVPEARWDALMGNRIGLLVGQAMADYYGWEVGDTLPLFSSIYPQTDGDYDWEFVLEATFTGTGNEADEMQAFAHYEYFNEARAFGTDLVGWLVTKIEDPERAPEVAAAIDARFANSPTETRTSTEAGFAAAFTDQFGNIGLIIQSILACVFFTLLLITGNTMAQSVRERTSEIAVMKTLGFTDRLVLALVLAESLAMALVGGLIGLAIGTLLIDGMAAAMAQFFPGLAPSPAALVTGVGAAILLGIATGALPAWRAARLRVVDAMGRR